MRISFTSLLMFAGLFSSAATLVACSGEVAVGSNEKQLQVKSDGKPTGDGNTCSWAGTSLRPADDCSSVPTPAGYGPYAVGDDFPSPDGCNECSCTERGIMCTVRECGGSTMDQESVTCTLEAKICPDGSAVGRQGPDCEFAPCSGEEGEEVDSCAIACTKEAKVCPDGSSVGRTGPDCEFAPCPDGEVVCPGDVMECPDGSYVSRKGADCAFAACPDEEGIACDLDAKICPDGSAVGRTGPDCEFAPCPYEPCVDKACGDTCTLCAPDDADCAETAVVKTCSEEGVCEAGDTVCR